MWTCGSPKLLNWQQKVLYLNAFELGMSQSNYFCEVIFPAFLGVLSQNVISQLCLMLLHACLQIMKPPESKSGPPSRQTIAARLAAGKAKPVEARSSQQDIQAKVSIYYVVQSPKAPCGTQANESCGKHFSIPNTLL